MKTRPTEVLRQLSKNKGALVGGIVILVLVLVALTADLWIDFDTQVAGINISQRLQNPSLEHPMGTDILGRDIFYRVLYGTRYSLPIGFVAVLIALFIGAFLGVAAGYFGRTVDSIIMRAADIFASIPSLLLGIVLVTAFGKTMFNLMLAVGLASVPLFIQNTRASVLRVREQEFVEAALAVGTPGYKIMFKHILPNCLSPIIVLTTLRIASAIASASALSFLGLAIPAPAPEWGSMLSEGREVIRSHSYMTFFPGLMILVTVLSFNLVGNALRDALDPTSKKP